MYKGTIKELAERYNRREKLIELMIKIGINEGCGVQDTIKIIEEFYNSKVNL